MEDVPSAKYCQERLDALRYAVPKIARVFAHADGVLAPEPRPASPGDFLSSRPVDGLRLALLEDNLQRLRDAQRLFRPIVESSSAMLERIDNIASRVESTRQRLATVQLNECLGELERLSSHITVAEKRLVALNRLMEHLNPSLSSIDHERLTSDFQLNSDGILAFERLLETANSLLASKRFCDSLNELEYLKGSAVLLEASRRLTSNLDKVCELSFLWMQKASRRMSTLLCKAFEEASGLALRHCSSFVPNLPGAGQVSDEFGLHVILEHGAAVESSLALRVLQLLQLRPAYLFHFVNGMRDILGQISLKRFAAYAGTVSIDPCNRSAAVGSVLDHLESSVSFMKSCVIGLYGNAGLPLYYSESHEHGIVFAKAPSYLRGILECLVNPVEAKLSQVMAADAVRCVEGVITCSGIVDAFSALHLLGAHIVTLEKALATPWVVGASRTGISIGGPVEEGSESEVETDRAAESDCEVSGGEPEDALLAMLRQVQVEWRKHLFSCIEERVVHPLGGESSSFDVSGAEFLDISAPSVVHTICEFIGDAVRVQQHYAPSDDFLEILERTVNPTINWCQKSASAYGADGGAYLINCFTQLERALDPSAVPASFKALVRGELESHVSSTVSSLLSELRDHLQIDAARSGSVALVGVLQQISCLVFGDGLTGCDLPSIKKLKLLASRYQRVIKSRVYVALADEYRALSPEKECPQVETLVAFASQL